ncbi:MAG: diguanylate cyclase [Pseudomonadota bacterium]
MSDVHVRKSFLDLRYIDAKSALGITHALHSDLNIEAVVERLLMFAQTLADVTAVTYENTDPEVEVCVGNPAEHQLSYQLRLTSTSGSPGTLTLDAEAPFSAEHINRIQELMSLAASPLLNAHDFLRLRGGEPAGPKAAEPHEDDENATDSVVLIRVEGLDEVTLFDGEEVAGQVMDGLREQLTHNLREADGIMSIDEDKLAVLLPSTQTQGADRVARKAAALVQNLDFLSHQSRGVLSVGVGISSSEDGDTAADILAVAKGELDKATQKRRSDQTFH